MTSVDLLLPGRRYCTVLVYSRVLFVMISETGFRAVKGPGGRLWMASVPLEDGAYPHRL